METMKDSCKSTPLTPKTSMRHNYLLTCTFIVSVFLLPAQTVGCPIQVSSACHCVDELDGVLLNCSPPSAVELLELLRSSQSQLGLLKSLTIRDTKIPLLSSNFFSGLYIKRLEMIGTGIQTVEKGAFSGLEPVLQELTLARNELTSIPVEPLSGLSSLLKLDLSNNSIAELKAEDALPRLPKLFDINLSHNKMSAIHKSFFENAKGSLQTINIGHNLLEEVPAQALRGFRQLMALHLHNNQLKSLAALSFMNLPILSLLNLASNKIHTIHRQAFLNAPNLRYLYLTDNQLTGILPHQFSSFEQLEMIDLSNNRIEVLQNDSFSSLPAIRQLYLGENRISRIGEYAFANSTLVILILESNQLTEVNKEMFQGANKLQQLSLKDNKIKSVDPNAFYNNPSLVMVDLSKNQVMDLAPATFLSQLNMLLVDLSANKLLRTPFSAFNRRVVTVLLQENPLVCSEKVHMLQQGVGVYVPNSEDLVCNGEKPRTTTTPLPLAKETALAAQKKSLIDELTPAEESSFIQGPTMEAPKQARLPNIRPLNGIRKISTPQINEFIDQSQASSIPTEDASQASEQASTHIPRIISPESESTEAASSLLSSRRKLFDTQAQNNTETLMPKQPVDPANDPNVIYPLSVPFLEGPKKKVNTAHNVGNSGEQGNVVITHTLPPSIVIGPPPRKHGADVSWNEVVSFTQTVPLDSTFPTRKSSTSAEAKYTRIEEFDLQDNSVSQASASERFPYDFEDQQLQNGNGQTTLPTAIIIVCLSTVGLVMAAVFVGMCVAKRRQIRLIGSGSSTTGSGNCIVGAPIIQHPHQNGTYMSAAHAAQMNIICGTGTLSRGRDGSMAGTLNRMPPLQDDIYGWLYSPYNTSTYAHPK